VLFIVNKIKKKRTRIKMDLDKIPVASGGNNELLPENNPTTTNERKSQVFECHLCKIYSTYDYYGSKPLTERKLSIETNNPIYNKKETISSDKNLIKRDNLTLLEKAYICDDPFSEIRTNNYLILGAKCSSCHKMVCVDSECSIFYYTKRFCLACCKNISKSEFPLEINEEIEKILNKQVDNDHNDDNEQN
jgi:hypothetical protein